MLALFAQQSNIIEFPPSAVGQAKSNEWYTPRYIIEAAREVMGSIDLDPASCKEANQIIHAKRYYTHSQNGLEQEWHGRVWLNPPFAQDHSLPNGMRSGIAHWVDKLICSYELGNISQAILLSTVRTDAKWFEKLWLYAICFANHNVRFKRPYDTPGRPGRFTTGHMHGTCFIYLGPNNNRFAEVFSEFGPVIPANVAIRRQRVTPLRLWEDEG